MTGLDDANPNDTSNVPHQPTPPSTFNPWPKLDQVGLDQIDVAGVDLKHVVVDEVVDVDELPRRLEIFGVVQVGRLEERQRLFPMTEVTRAHVVRLADQIDVRLSEVLRQVVDVDALSQVVDAPRLSIEIEEHRSGGRTIPACLAEQRVHERVAHARQILDTVVATHSEHQRLKALPAGGVEQGIVERVGAVLRPKIQHEALLRKFPRRVAQDP